MTRISRICVAGGAIVGLPLSTGSAWAPISGFTTSPKMIHVPKVVTPHSKSVNPSVDQASPKFSSGFNDAASKDAIRKEQEAR
jgi:hypothetical protein